MRRIDQRGQSSVEVAALLPVLGIVVGLVLWLAAVGVSWLGAGVTGWSQARRQAVDPTAPATSVTPSGVHVRRVAGPAGVVRVEAERTVASPWGTGRVRIGVQAEAAAP